MIACDCVFVFPPGGDFEGDAFGYTVGGGYVIAYLREKGFQAAQFHCSEPLSAGACAGRILGYAPKVVGFTVCNTNFIACLLIAEKIKALNPCTIVVFGGPTISNHARYIVRKHPCVDVCVRNEGEEVFYALYQKLTLNCFKIEDSSLNDIPGITYRDNGKVRHNPNADVLLRNSHVANYLDNYPSPYLTGVIPPEKAWTVGIITARGCNQNCIYCNCAVLSQRRFSMHSIERVVAEIEYLSHYVKGHQLLSIFDDAFTLVPNRAKKICRMIIENGIKVNLGCITRCDCVDREMLDLMKAAGFISVGFSLESAVPRLLRIIGKVSPAEDIPSGSLEKEERFIDKLGEVAAYAKQIGISDVYSSIMIGLPTETVEEANRTVDAIDAYGSINSYTHNLLTIHHGTPIYHYYREYGYEVENIGHVPIFAKTKYRSDFVSNVRISEKSNLHKKRKQYDKDTVKILSLLSKRTEERPYFEKVILLADRLHKDFVESMKATTSINAFIVHIYSSQSKFGRYNEEDGKRLYRYYSPSLNLHNYYFSPQDGYNDIVSSFSVILKDVDSDIHPKTSDTRIMLKRYAEGERINFAKVVCKDHTLEDVGCLLQLLKSLAAMKDPFQHLLNSRPTPCFSGLCRWTNGGANCQTMETAIVDGDGNIRLCWIGEPVGRVGDPFADIRARVNDLRERAVESRRCRQCPEQNHCSKCIMPTPMSAEAYCAAVTTHRIASQADLLRNFHFLYDYLRS